MAPGCGVGRPERGPQPLQVPLSDDASEAAATKLTGDDGLTPATQARRTPGFAAPVIPTTNPFKRAMMML
jgi:hypothetical protein